MRGPELCSHRCGHLSALNQLHFQRLHFSKQTGSSVGGLVQLLLELAFSLLALSLARRQLSLQSKLHIRHLLLRSCSLCIATFSHKLLGTSRGLAVVHVFQNNFFFLLLFLYLRCC